MKKLLILAAAALTLFACTKEPVDPNGNQAPDGQVAASFNIHTPKSGAMTLAGTPGSDVLAMKGEATINLLQILVFAPGGDTPTGTTDDYRLEGVFIRSGGPLADATTIGDVFTIEDVYVKVGGSNNIKHVYFVANYELPVGHDDSTFTETQMIQQLMTMDNLPYVNHAADPLEVLVDLNERIFGLPMSGYAEIDCTSAAAVQKPTNGSSNADVELKRSVARYDVVNHTLNYRVLSVEAHAFDSAYIMDTLQLRTLPANTFPADYLADPTALNPAAAPRLQDMRGKWFTYPAIVLGPNTDAALAGIQPRSLNDNGTAGDPSDDFLNPAVPVAAGYLFPTAGTTAQWPDVAPYLADSSFVRVQYEEWIDTGTTPGDGVLDGIRDSWSGDTLSVDVRFRKNDVYTDIKRNHVYRITLHEDPYLVVDAFEIEEWEQSTAVLPLPIAVPTVIKFTNGGGTAGTTFTQTAGGSGNTQVTFPATGGTWVIKIDTDGATPKLAENNALPSWLTANNTTGEPGNMISSVIEKVGNAYQVSITAAALAPPYAFPQWANGRSAVVYVTLDGNTSNPTSSFRITQTAPAQ